MGAYDFQNFSQNVGTVRSEPASMPLFILQWATRIGDSLDDVAKTQKLNKYALISLKQKIRFLHAHTRLRGDFEYYQKYKALKFKLDEMENDDSFWVEQTGAQNKNNYMLYFDTLMDWYDLEADTYERFNLIPAEDEDFMFEEAPWIKLGFFKE